MREGRVDRGSRGRRRWVRRVLTILVGVLLVVLLLALAGVALLYHQGRRDPGGTGEYVALGSSFAAGPGVGDRADGSPFLCGRSADNYAHRLSEALGLSLTDVTCSGATTAHVLDGGQFFQPAQLDAVRASTRLVTVTIGGNDVSLLGNLFAWSCDAGGSDTPAAWRAVGACDETAREDVDAALDELPDQLVAIVDAVRARAPEAHVVLLDYQSITPATGSCPDRLPITDAHLERARTVEAALNEAVRNAAAATGADFVSAHDATAGHDVCAADPWITSHTYPAFPGRFGPIPFHPTETGMTRVAEALHQRVKSTSRWMGSGGM